MRNDMALSELPPALDEGGEPGAEPPLLRMPPPGAMSRAWLGRLQGVDAPWTEARRARRAQLLGFDHAPIVIATAKGSNLFDLDGNRFVDFAAAFGAALVGHGNSRVVRTLEMQLERTLFGLGDVYPTDAKIGLTERLARLFPEPGARVLFGLSGSDAIDAAMKTALLATGRPGILAFEGSYHGLGTGPLAACGLRPEFRVPFAPHLTPHVRFLPYPSAPRRDGSGGDSLERALAAVETACTSGEIGALLVEPVLGRGGVVVPPAGFLAGLREICTRHGVLLVADEIWTGLGRSGAMLCSVEDGVIPDLVCLAKGLGGGVPISACIGKGSVMEAWRTPKGRAVSAEEQEEQPHGEAIHTSTYAGSPLACATALAMLDTVIGTKLVQRSRDEGAAFREALSAALGEGTRVVDVRGRGFMIGIEVEGGARRGLGLMHDLLQKGYVALTGGNGDVVTLTPPLNIAKPLLDGFVETFAELARLREP
jgi:4-aminobutyrate aminotransferase/(S)-3-amino-2-methylpropionate transaminase